MKNKVNRRGDKLAKSFFGRGSAIRRGKSGDAGRQEEIWRRGDNRYTIDPPIGATTQKSNHFKK